MRLRQAVEFPGGHAPCSIGSVGDVKVLRSVTLLDSAALEAVRQWRYTPTLLNGVPVKIIVVVTIAFTLTPPRPVTF